MSTEQELNGFLKEVERRAFKRTVYAVRDEDAALDIVQDSMIRLAEKYADRPADEWPMLFQRILSNATLDWFRRRRTRESVMQNFSALQGPLGRGNISLARPSTGSLPAALLGRIGRQRDGSSDGMLGGQREDALLPGRSCFGKGAEKQGI